MPAYSDGSASGSKTRSQAIADAKRRKKPVGGGKFQPPKSPPRGADDPF